MSYNDGRHLEIEFQFTFTEDVERERIALRTVLLDALTQNTLPAIQSAQNQLREWLQKHPEDYGMRDAGEPLALTEDALLAEAREHIAAKAF